MLKIKLARFGKRHQPHFRIVVTEARSKRDGKYTALLGHYAPTQSPKILEVNLEEYNNWLKRGAQPTDTVAGLAKRFESGTPFPEKKPRPSKKARAKVAAAAETEAAEATAAQEAATAAKEVKAAPEVATPETSTEETATPTAE